MKKSIVAVSLAVATSAGFAQDAAEGQKAFQQCAACHAIAKGVNGVGPTLFGIVGSKTAEVPGFNFSPAMKSANFIWTPQNLDTFLADPQKKVPGNTMPYPGIGDAKQRAALIAYMQTLK
jgi:cytochrome c